MTWLRVYCNTRTVLCSSRTVAAICATLFVIRHT